MIKIWGFVTIAGPLLCVLEAATGPPASALDRYVELTNNTRATIVEIYSSHVGSGDWQSDILGDEFLPPGQSILVKIDAGADYCRFDFKTIFDDGESLIRRNVNICEVERYAICHR
jgi:hypothetical protein